jgi:hypothetical protein
MKMRNCGAFELFIMVEVLKWATGRASIFTLRWLFVLSYYVHSEDIFSIATSSLYMPGFHVS